MNELQVIVRQDPGQIKFNFDELKAALSERMDLYKDAIFTEESKTEAKAELAALRKMKKALDDRRKAVKSEWNKPYMEFEAKAKELTALIDAPINLIDKQIKEMEERRKADKKLKIDDLFNQIVGDMSEYVTLDQIYDARWENSSVTLKSIQEDIAQRISYIQDDVKAISESMSEAKDDALNEYKKSHDISKAYDVINQYERHKAEILRREEERRKAEEDRRRQEEIDRIRKQERERILEEERIREEERHRVEECVLSDQLPETVKKDDEGFFSSEADGELPFEQPDTVTAFYKVVATVEELEQVEMAFNSIGIYFERRVM